MLAVGILVVVALSFPEAAWAILIAAPILGALLIALNRYRKLSGLAAKAIPELVLLPLALGLRPFSATWTLASLSALLLFALFRLRRAPKHRASPLPLIALALAIGLVILRAANPVDIAIAAVTLLLLLRVTARTKLAAGVGSLVDGLGLYLIASVALYLAGIQSPGAATRTGGLEGADGAIRVIFPLSSSLNLPPAIAAVCIAGLVLVWREQGRARRLFRLLAFAAALAVLILAGARAPLLAAALPLLIALLPNLSRIAAPVVTGFAVLSAWLLPGVISVAVPALQWGAQVIPTLFRSTAIDSTTALNGRQTIWASSWEFWRAVPFEDQLIGYGQFGQASSGASQSYAYIFGNALTNAGTASVHNSFLQQLFDGGWLGAAALSLFALWSTIRWARTAKTTTLPHLAGISMLLVLAVLGTSEVTLAPGYSQETFWVFAALGLYGIRSAPRVDQEEAVDRRGYARRYARAATK